VAVRNKAQKTKIRKRSNDLDLEKTANATEAGSTLGSSFDGPATGDEVKPALPSIFPDPRIPRSELPNGVQGDVIVEIERGEGLDTGMFRVTAEVYTGGDVAPAPSGYDPGPSYNPYAQQGYPGGAPAGGGPARNARLVSNDGRTYPLSIGSTVIDTVRREHLPTRILVLSARPARVREHQGGQQKYRNHETNHPAARTGQKR